MRTEDDHLIYLAGGGIGAILLGMAMVPLRDFTTASNFTFPFMALTILVAEFGGPRAALVTALASALSLDFFLTQPYLRLTIAGKHDIIAFLGLAACGLIVAACSTGRRRKMADIEAAREHLNIVHALLRCVEQGGPVTPTLAEFLQEAREVLPVSSLVTRDAEGKVVAASGEGAAGLPPPTQEMAPDSLLPPGATCRDLPAGGLPLPGEGGRLPMAVGDRRMGWLEIRGSGAPANAEERRSLSDIGRLAGLWLARGDPSS
jgi:K+-sensing histidine kinase KdpD